MSTRTMKRAGGASTKKKATPKFLLVKDGGDEDGAAEPGTADDVAPVEAEGPAGQAADDDWPEREDIRNGLVDQVSSRFGISQDAAIRAVDDMLRLS